MAGLEVAGLPRGTEVAGARGAAEAEVAASRPIASRGAEASAADTSAVAEEPERTRPVADSVTDSEEPGLSWEATELFSVWTATWSVGEEAELSPV